MESNSSEARTIYEAMLRVMEEVSYIQKKSSPGVKYKFVGEAETLETLRPVLLRNQILVYPVNSEVVGVDRYTTAGGANMGLVRIAETFRFHHVPSGSSIDVRTVGEGSDGGDKASPKAMTIALKYALRQSFLIQTGDDPDEEVNERAGAKDLSRQQHKTKILKSAGDAIAKATSEDRVLAVLADPRCERYPSVRSELKVLAERRIAELS